jgi:hypothetical protein
MVTHLRGKNVQTHQDDEVRYAYTPTKQSYNTYFNNILLSTSSKEEKWAWANKVGLVGMFEVEWKFPYHNIMVEFLNNWMLDFEHNRIKVMLGEE